MNVQIKTVSQFQTILFCLLISISEHIISVTIVDLNVIIHAIVVVTYKIYGLV